MPFAIRCRALLLLCALLLATLPFAPAARAATLTVTTTADSGTGSLRAAITAANASSNVPDTITFSIPAGSVITLQTALPALTDNATTIQGPTTNTGKPGVEIKGKLHVGPGLALQSSNNVIRNLVLNDFSQAYPGDLNSGAGITITGSGNTIENCYIGTNAAGTGPVAEPAQDNNDTAGIFITDAGSTNTINNNVISGNAGYGVYIGSNLLSAANQFRNGNTISNNRIGVTADGTARLRNVQDGVYIGDNANDNVVGPGNVITGNGPQSASISDPLRAVFNVQISGRIGNSNTLISGNKVQGNKIGTDANGKTTITNPVDGIGSDSAASLVIGGANPPDSANADRGNIIAGNFDGVVISTRADRANSITGLVIANNWVGLDGTGTAAAANQGVGIRLNQGVSNAMIGPGNVLSGNGVNGMVVGSTSNARATTTNTIKNNFVGTNAAGTAAVANGGAGIRLINTRGNLVDSNRLAYNRGDGITLESGAAANKITRTTTTGNTGAGIALGGGTNNGVLPPTVTGLTATGTAPNQTLNGLVDPRGANCGTNGCTIEVFQSATSENYEGPAFLVSFTVAGNQPFSAQISGCNQFLTFTITDQAGNTSEFSQASTRVNGCGGVTPPSGAVAELTPATQTLSGGPGDVLTYNHTLRNTGSVGNFTLAVSGLPAGWTGTVSPNSITLAAGASQQVQVLVTIPAGATGGSYPFTLTATPQGGTPATARDTAQVVITAGATLTPATQTQQAGPTQQVCYDHTLTNTGNSSDTFTITAAVPQGWAAPTIQPGSVTLARNASQTVTVCVTVPQNATTQQYITTVTATSGANPQVSASATDITDVQANVAVPQLSPAQQAAVNPGANVNFVHTLTNVGSVTGMFALALDGVPAGWTSVITPSTPVTLAPNASTTVTVTLGTPATAIAGPYPIGVRATNTAVPGISNRVVDTVNINRITGIALSNDQASTEPPSTTVTYTLALTNSGNFTDTVNLQAATSRSGWSAQPISPTITLGPRSSTALQVRLVIPPGQVAGTKNVTTITATSATNQGVSDTALITTTVAAVPGVLLQPQPGITRPVTPGQPVTYTFTLLNSGSVTQTDTLTISGVPAGWTSELTPTSVVDLAPGITRTVRLVLMPPADAPYGTTRVTLQASAQTVQGSATSSVFAQAVVGPPYDVQIAPDRSGSQQIGLPIRYVHVVTNTGQLSDTYDLLASSAQGWDVSVAPSSLRLIPGASGTVTVTVVVPRSASAGDVDTTTVTAQSRTTPAVSARATDTTTATQSSGISFSPSRALQTTAGTEVQFQHVIVNLGNGPDMYTVQFTQTLDWKVTVQPTQTVLLPRGGTYAVNVRVQVPSSGVNSATEFQLRLRAVSMKDPAISEEVQDIITLPPGQPLPIPVQLFKNYLPVVQR